jgi:hypothetical protein
MQPEFVSFTLDDTVHTVATCADACVPSKLDLICAEILHRGGWEPQLCVVAKALLKARPGGWLVDVGAHVGTYTVIGMNTPETAQVLAFEPHPGHLAALRKTVGDCAKVRVCACRVSDAPGGRVADFVPADATVALLKVDIEGGEPDVVQGCAGVNVAAYLLEITPKHGKERYAAMLLHLAEKGYVIRDVGLGGRGLPNAAGTAETLLAAAPDVTAAGIEAFLSQVAASPEQQTNVVATLGTVL